jgi:hypothetical protein
MYKVILIIFLLILIIYLCHQYKISENFDYNTLCKSCNTKGTFECRNCDNCGVCVTEMGDMYCTKGDLSGPFERTDCFKWEYGNIYPQYDDQYYNNGVELRYKDDPKHYPYSLYLNSKYNTNIYSDKNVLYKNFDIYLKPNLYKR